MSITTPSMGLKRWDQPNDIFSYTELSDNFNTLDLHDHTGGKGVQIPTEGLANLAVTETKLANLAVSGAKIANVAVTDAKLASPNNGSWRTVAQFNARIPAGATAASYTAAHDGSLVASGGATALAVPLLPWNAAHYTVAGKTLQLRLTVAGVTNATAPGQTIAFSLRQVATAGGTGVISYTLNTPLSGTEASFLPAANANVTNSATIAAPVGTQAYAMGITIGGTTAAGSWSSWTMIVQYAHV